MQAPLIRWLIRLGFGGVGLVCTVGYAAQCGLVEFLSDRSRGVEVQLDLCPGKTEVSQGAILTLAPGARLWLKVPQVGEPGREYQMVCQSRSEGMLALLVESQAPPWIGSVSLRCAPWDGSRLACASADGKPNVLFCVAGRFDQPSVETLPEKGASIVLRSAGRDLGGMEDPARRQAVLEAVRSEVELCHALYGVTRQFEVEWEVDAAGKVIEITPTLPIERIDPEFADCLTSAIRSYPYPKSSRTVFLSAIL